MHLRTDLQQEEPVSEPVIKKSPRYPNWKAHPEYQNLLIEAGFRSALMKQLETNEKLLRVLINIELRNLSKKDRKEMKDRYSDLL